MFYRTVILMASLPLLSAAADNPPHWAFQPLTAAPPPAVMDTTWPKSDVDRFFLARLEQAGRQPAPPADSRTLLRRITYDLTGLPPTAEEVESFAASAADPSSFSLQLSSLLDRLLASPAYGEKWGRAWLDVARYADTAGETADCPMPHAWRYRNWVIKAFNDDLPYDEFVRWQIAGDLLSADGPPEQAAEKTVATGFLAVARRFGFDIEKDMHLTYEDTIDTVGKSFMGLSLGCARCHDHKYDPVSQRDYYALYGILQSTRFPYTGCEKTMRPRDMVPVSTAEQQRAHKVWEAEFAAVESSMKQREAALAALAPEFTASTLTKIAEGTLTPGASQTWPPDAGAGTLNLTEGEMLQLSILPRGNFGADGTGLEWTISETAGEKRQWSLAGAFGDPAKPLAGWYVLDLEREPRLCVRYDAEFEKTAGLAAWRGAELWPALLINTKNLPNAYETFTLPPHTMGVHPGPRGGIAVAWQSPLAGSVSVSLKVSEFDPGGDGIDWKLERRALPSAVLEKQRALFTAQMATVKTRAEILAREPRSDLALAVTEATPVNARLQKKGEPKDPGDEVPRGMLSIFGGAPIPGNAGSGRRELADWLTRGAARHLTARVMVNRIWQGHFGEGLVSTPNDFGTRGQPPSDPALLDFLAGKFIASGWSVKAMHRMMILCAAYQRASQQGDQSSLISNQKVEPLITRSLITDYFPRRRLTAEELRDTLLMVSGSLDRTPGGPHPFPPEAGWKFTQHDPFAAVYETNKRSVYLMVQRTRRHPYLALFDGADPYASTPSRGQSTVPTQALYFLNDPAVHSMAKSMAQRLVAAAGEDAARMNLTTSLLYGRLATRDEKSIMAAFLAETSAAVPSLSEPERTIEIWTAWLRVLFGTSELLYVD